MPKTAVCWDLRSPLQVVMGTRTLQPEIEHLSSVYLQEQYYSKSISPRDCNHQVEGKKRDYETSPSKIGTMHLPLAIPTGTRYEGGGGGGGGSWVRSCVLGLVRENTRKKWCMCGINVRPLFLPVIHVPGTYLSYSEQQQINEMEGGFQVFGYIFGSIYGLRMTVTDAGGIGSINNIVLALYRTAGVTHTGRSRFRELTGIRYHELLWHERNVKLYTGTRNK